MDERRRHHRHQLCFPIKVDTRDKRGQLGMCRDASMSGVMFATPSRFELGDKLLLCFKVSPEDPKERYATGKVVRIGPDKPIDSWFPRIVAVELDGPRPELGQLFEREAPRHARMFD